MYFFSTEEHVVVKYSLEFTTMNKVIRGSQSVHVHQQSLVDYNCHYKV